MTTRVRVGDFRLRLTLDNNKDIAADLRLLGCRISETWVIAEHFASGVAYRMPVRCVVFAETRAIMH